MTETRPTYTTEPARQVDARRRVLLYAALDDAGAAEAALLALVAEVARLRDLLALGTLDDDALYAVRRALGDLRLRAEALGVGL
jgi:hypothetical protein